MFHLQRVFGTDADRQSDTVPVLRPPLKGLENQQIQGSLNQCNTPCVLSLFWHRAPPLNIIVEALW
jgi:hypothetical protein